MVGVIGWAECAGSDVVARALPGGCRRPCARIEGRGPASGDELHVAEDHEGVELEGDLRWVGTGSSSPAVCPAATSSASSCEPALAERHGAVADGARMRVELADGGDEEAAAGEDALLDVVEEPFDVGAQARHAGRRFARRLDHQLLEDRAGRLDRGQL